MNWKEDNPKQRYIDDITDEEAFAIAYLAVGKPHDFVGLNVERECNPNNIPHVKIYVKYYEPCSGEDIEDYVGIFDNLNTYHTENYMAVYCQREIVHLFEEFGFD